MYSAISGGQSGDPLLATASVTFGVTEATGGIMYAAGAYGMSGTAMAIGAGVAQFGGGAGAIVMGVARLPGDIRANDTPAVVADSASIVGGTLLLVALIVTGPVGAAVFVIGVGLVAFSGGFHLGRWMRQ